MKPQLNYDIHSIRGFLRNAFDKILPMQLVYACKNIKLLSMYLGNAKIGDKVNSFSAKTRMILT